MTWNWSSLKDILYPGIQFNNLILTSQFQEKITNQVSCSHINNLNFLHSIDCHLQFLPFQLQLIRPMIHVTKNSKYVRMWNWAWARKLPEGCAYDIFISFYKFTIINHRGLWFSPTAARTKDMQTSPWGWK